jgi:hypothetical protein
MKRSAAQRREVLERQIYHSPLDRSDWVFFGGLILVTCLAVATRLYKISQPAHVAYVIIASTLLWTSKLIADLHVYVGGMRLTLESMPAGTYRENSSLMFIHHLEKYVSLVAIHLSAGR